MMKRKTVLSCWLLVLILVLTSCGWSKSGQTASEFWIKFIDVGSGDAALVCCDGHYMLIDGGSENKGRRVKEVLEEEHASKLDLLVVTHVHEDHLGGMATILNYADNIKVTLCPVENDKRECFSNFLSRLTENGGGITVPQVGDRYNLGSAEIEVIATGDNVDKNESIVLLISYGENTFLFTGDMEKEMEKRLCDQYDDQFEVTMLKVGHHGSDTSTSYRFLRMLNPSYAVISCGSNQANENTLSRLRDADVELYRTDQDGTVLVRSDGTNLSFTTEK